MSKNESKTETATPVDTAPILALVEGAVTAWGETLSTTRRSVETLAVATYAAKPFIGGEAALWADVDAYRNLFPSLTGDGAISKSYVTLMARVGKCHALGITPESDPKSWGRLVQKANSDSRIRKAVDDEKATGPKVKRAIGSAYPKGVYAKEQKATDTAEGEQHGNTGSATEDTNGNVPNSVPAALALAEACLSYVSKQRESGVTPEESEHVVTMLALLESLTVTRADEAA